MAYQFIASLRRSELSEPVSDLMSQARVNASGRRIHIGNSGKLAVESGPTGWLFTGKTIPGPIPASR